MSSRFLFILCSNGFLLLHFISGCFSRLHCGSPYHHLIIELNEIFIRDGTNINLLFYLFFRHVGVSKSLTLTYLLSLFRNHKGNIVLLSKVMYCRLVQPSLSLLLITRAILKFVDTVL